MIRPLDDELIVQALRREAAPWPADATAGFGQAVVEAAADHGVTALLATAPAVASWPDGVRAALRSACRFEAAAEIVRRNELTSLLGVLDAAGIRTLLLKGAHLAYSHYPRPWLRPRLDTDLLIAPRDRDAADRVLRSRGYRPGTHFGGELVTHQFQYRRANRYGVTDVVDLHWKVANPHVFAEALTFEELDAGAVAIEALGSRARGLSQAHALLLACVHRAAHHGNSDCLIWLYDIHLLASLMGEDSRARVASLAGQKRLRAVCARGVADARARFATDVPPDWLAPRHASDGEPEPSAAFLRAGRTKMDILISDLQVLGGWQQRARLIHEHLFPPVDYMRRSYGFSTPLLLPIAYVDRALTGIGKWFHRDG